MVRLFPNTLLACGLALAAASLTAQAAPAAPAKTAKATDAKAGEAKPKAKAKSKPAVVKAVKPKIEEEPGPAPIMPEEEPDITGSTTVQYSCELGNTVTIHQNASDLASIALRWKKRLHRLTRIGTTTGAHRFENKNFGLVWIGIPAKGLLLDSRLNRQLANECKSPEQENPTVVVAPVAAVPPSIVAKPDPTILPAALKPEGALPATLPSPLPATLPAAATTAAPVILTVPAGTQSVVIPVPPGTTAVVVPVLSGTSGVVVPVPVAADPAKQPAPALVAPAVVAPTTVAPAPVAPAVVVPAPVAPAVVVPVPVTPAPAPATPPVTK